MEGEKQLTVVELVDGVIPCIKEKQYSETYIKGFQLIFDRLLSYCLRNSHNNSFWNAMAFSPVL